MLHTSKLKKYGMVGKLTGIACIIAGIASCSTGSMSGSDTLADVSQTADLVFQGGQVYTVDNNNSVVEAIAVKDGRIVALGSDELIAERIGEGTKVVDLHGKMLMPGLVDAHMHPAGAGAQLRSCSMGYESLTVDEILSRITSCLDAEKGRSDDSWLVVGAWFRQATKPAGADLTTAILDQLPTARPVVVVANDHHTLAANTAAMRAANITQSTPNPSDGSIVRDANGAATGIFLDGAMGIVMDAIPELSDAEKEEETLLDVTAAVNAVKKQGVTTIFSAGSNALDMGAFAKLRNADKLTVRSRFSLIISPEEAHSPKAVVDSIKGLATRFNAAETAQKPGITIDRAKIFVDGVIQGPAQTAALLKPYLHNVGSDSKPHWVPSEHAGALYYSEPLLTELLDELVANGLSAHMHTDGDGAVHAALNAVETVRRKHKDAAFFRPGLAHCELVEPSDYVRFAELDAIPVLSFQWQKRAPDTIDSVEDYVGPERFPYIETGGKFVEADARIAFGSDWPVDALAEWTAMQVGITRENPNQSNPKYQGRLGDDPGLDIQTAIRAYTINAAYHLNMEDQIGSLEVGKFADMIVVDRDLTSVDPHTIKDTKVLLTVVGGQEVYRDDTFQP